MSRRVIVMSGAVLVLVVAAAGWLALQGAGKDGNVVRPGDVPQCGPAWRSVEVAKPSAIYNELHGVAAVAADDVWAVGTLGEESAALTLVEHWDGKAWRHVASPNVEGFSNHLYSVAAYGANDVWAVGAHHNGTDQWQTTALHWDGQAWKIVPTPNVGPISSLNGVAAFSTDDIWAVGESSSGSKGQGTQALLMNWDGSSWKIVDSGVRLQNSTLSSVAVIWGDDIWAAGSYSDKSGTVARPLFVRWDGQSWKEVEAEGNGTIWSISAMYPSGVWAVGNFGPQSLAMHWDGSAWTRMPTPNVGSGNNALNGILAISDDDVWAVGSGYLDKADVTTAMHWAGREWKTTPAVTLGNYSDVLWGVAAVRGGDLWAVGAYIADERGNNAPIVERYSDPCGK